MSGSGCFVYNFYKSKEFICQPSSVICTGYWKSMANIIKVDGYEKLKEELRARQGGRIFILFCGSKNADGKSWCSDCVKAEPVVMDKAKTALAGTRNVLFYCTVGDRDSFRSPSNPFRTDPDFNVTCVPTLLELGRKEKRLGDKECSDPDVVDLIFEED